MSNDDWLFTFVKLQVTGIHIPRIMTYNAIVEKYNLVRDFLICDDDDDDDDDDDISQNATINDCDDEKLPVMSAVLFAQMNLRIFFVCYNNIERITPETSLPEVWTSIALGISLMLYSIC